MATPPTAHFGFTKLLVTDLEASAAFYTSVFGLKETARVTSAIADRPIDEIIFSPTGAGAATFVLLRYGDVSAPASEEVILGFITDDLPALVARAVSAGGSVVQEPYDNVEHKVKVGFVADNEGHLIEVVQPAEA